MDFVNAISSLAGYSTAYSNMTTQSSGLNASTVDKIKKFNIAKHKHSNGFGQFVFRA